MDPEGECFPERVPNGRHCKAGMSELIIVTGTDSISPKGAEPTGRLISTDSCFTLHRRGNALFHNAIAYQSGLGFTIHGQVPGTGHQKIELCFTICFTVCLFISPDLNCHTFRHLSL